MQRTMSLTPTVDGCEVAILATDNSQHITVSIVIGGVCVAAIGVPKPTVDTALIDRDMARLTRELAGITIGYPARA